MRIWDLAPKGFDKAQPWGPARWWVLVPIPDWCLDDMWVKKKFSAVPRCYSVYVSQAYIRIYKYFILYTTVKKNGK